jgi:hypothetical protein
MKASKTSNTTAGEAGTSTSFGNILIANGGTGGGVGTNILSNVVDGVNGIDGNIINCSFDNSQIENRTFIPVSYIPAQSICYSTGYSNSDCYCNYDGMYNPYRQGCEGLDGENGAIVISY